VAPCARRRSTASACVEVARGDEFRATRLQGEQQGDRLRLQVNAGANGEAGKGLGAGELFGNATQQLRLLGDPINPRALHAGECRAMGQR
jgi:hypothetical protein